MDVPLTENLNELLELPKCVDIKLPKPKPLKITLPTGGSIKAFSDLSKGIPNDCALTFSLMLQIAPFLAASECLFKLLGLIAPLIDVIKGLGPPPDVIKLGSAIPKFLKAAEKLAPCLLAITGAPLIPFIKDLLCLIIKALNCLLGQLKTLLGIMNGITLQLATARADGNADLIATLECAKENANTQAQHLTAAIEPIGVILELASPLMEVAGVGPIKLPGVGSETDIQSLQGLVKTLQSIIATLTIAADALGGCD